MVVSALSAVAAILAAGKWSRIGASVTHTGVARLCRMWSGVCAAIWANANAAVAGVESRRPSPRWLSLRAAVATRTRPLGSIGRCDGGRQR